MTYPVELRKRVIAKLEAGFTQRETAAQLAVSHAWVNKIWQCQQRHGSLFPPRKTMGRPRKFNEAALQRLKTWVDEDPDQTLHKLADRMAAHLGIPVSDVNILLALRTLGYTHKKNGRPRRTKTR